MSPRKCICIQKMLVLSIFLFLCIVQARNNRPVVKKDVQLSCPSLFLPDFPGEQEGDSLRKGKVRLDEHESRPGPDNASITNGKRGRCLTLCRALVVRVSIMCIPPFPSLTIPFTRSKSALYPKEKHRKSIAKGLANTFTTAMASQI